jgi:hypothetical protein
LVEEEEEEKMVVVVVVVVVKMREGGTLVKTGSAEQQGDGMARSPGG